MNIPITDIDGDDVILSVIEGDAQVNPSTHDVLLEGTGSGTTTITLNALDEFGGQSNITILLTVNDDEETETPFDLPSILLLVVVIVILIGLIVYLSKKKGDKTVIYGMDEKPLEDVTLEDDVE